MNPPYDRRYNWSRAMVNKMSKKNEIEKKKYHVSKIQKITAERLRTFKGFETYTDEKAKKMIQELEKYARIIIRHITTKK
ncbi:hypothetical protein [Aquimarina aggregata]|uniref:hypothetical protein n=1 Tax=Aquimarina aggregata TaxID=1642818 RepID=UPI00249108A7|nr:hypothetical protein [Aquimarina aggregata]